MERRNRNLIAILLTIVMVAAECSTVFAASVKETPAKSEPEILGLSGFGYAGPYTIECDHTYGAIFPNAFVVKDYQGNVLPNDSYTVTLSYNYKEKHYDSQQGVYVAGLKPGDKMDLDIDLIVKEEASPISPTETGFVNVTHKGTVRNVEVKKGQITKSQLMSGLLCDKDDSLARAVEDRKIPWRVYDYYMVYGGGCRPYLKLTDKGAEKLAGYEDLSFTEYVTLNAYEDFDLRIERLNRESNLFYPRDTYRDDDITDYFDIDITGASVKMTFFGSSELRVDTKEIRMGTTAAEFRDFLKKHTCLKIDGKVYDAWDSSNLELTDIVYYSENGVVPLDDDKALEEALSREGNQVIVYLKTESYVDGKEEVHAESSASFIVRKNAYKLVLEPFKEVASATGASYDRVKHDLMVNAYAIKNETEKVLVGSLGDGERLRLNVFDDKNRVLKGEEKRQLFENFRPGDKLTFDLKWYLPSEGRYIKYSDRPLEFFDYGGSEFADPVSSNYADPFSDAHRTDGYDVGELAADAAPYEFDVFRSSTAIGAVPVKITQKFRSYVSMNGFDPFANHRFTSDNKKIAIVDKKGYLKPKKRGMVNIYLEQKTDDGGWIQIGNPIEIFVQVPEMKKKVFVSTGEEIFAHTFISRTTFAPNRWISTKPSVATIDEKTGKITPISSGTTKIIAVYGDPNDRKKNSKKKYKTTLRVN